VDLVFVDVETTGGAITTDRLTEIAIIRVREGVEVARWSSLINPQQKLSPFIQRLTGITDAMLEDAPLFDSIAEQVKQQLADALFVAHNARFDYGFIKNAFLRAGISWSAKTLCTVKLSRKLYPQYHKHGLDKIIARHNIPCGDRHRAMADTEATMRFYQLARDEFGAEKIDEITRQLIKRPALPPNLPPDLLDQIPTTPGVYRFWDGEGALLYVGKSVNMAQRVASHFQADTSSNKAQQMSQQVHSIDWLETAGDLGAQLLELQQIKQHKPIHNRRSRQLTQLHSFKLQPDSAGYLRVELSDAIDGSQLDQHYGMFKTRSEAKKALQGIVQSHGLCNRLAGLEQGEAGCFLHQLERCRGACEGLEPAENYNLRLQIALQSLQLKTWPWDGPIAIREHEPFTGRRECHIIWNWCHLVTLQNEQQWQEWQTEHCEVPALFDRDCYRLLMRYLFDGKQKPDVVIL